MVKYLLEYRLQWGKPDTLSLLKSAIVDNDANNLNDGASYQKSGDSEYFKSDTPPSLISIIQNDWPYSVPLDIEHTLIWTRVPILPSPHLIPPHVAESLSDDLRTRVTKRLEQDGIWGFTGSLEPPPPPPLLSKYLGALSEWGITMEKLIRSSEGSPDEETLVTLAGNEIRSFINRRWDQAEWETAWFVNPPRLQSVKGLAHAHVFARKKSDAETVEWQSRKTTEISK